MSKREKGDGGPVTSFGIPGGGTLFESARRDAQWTVWKSVAVVVGLAGLCLGIAYAAWGLAIVSGLVLFGAALRTGSSVRSYRSARRLQRRLRDSE